MVEQVYQVYDAALQVVGWVVVASDGSVESYNISGDLLSIEDKQGRAVAMSYSDGTAAGGYALDANWNSTTTTTPGGLLIAVTDSFGRSLHMGYSASSQLVQVTDPSGLNYRYTYDASGNLASVIYPDGKTRQYLYNEAAYTGGTNLPNSLTGIVDENGTRFASYWYNSSGQATQEVHWADSAQTKSVDQYLVTINTNGTTTMTDPLNSQSTFSYQVINGVHFPTSQSQPAGAGCGPTSSSSAYDANGNATSRQDFNGNITTYSYDTTRNLETQRVEAHGTAQARTINTQWHPNLRVPVRRAEPKKITTWVYNGQPDPTNGNVTASCSATSAAPVGQVALLEFDGANGSSTFVDSYGHPFSRYGGATLSAAEAKFGTTSGQFNGTTDYISTPDAPEFDFTGDFTVEGWFYITATATATHGLIAKSTNINTMYTGWEIAINSNNFVQALYTQSGTGWDFNQTSPTSVTPNTWHHVAMVRSGSTITMYYDGVGFGATTVSGAPVNGATPLEIGTSDAANQYPFVGYIDEVRISSVARYTANFTPPTGAFVTPIPMPNGLPIAVLCKRVEQATTDTTGASGFNATASGSPRIWNWTYNQWGQVLTAKSPRTDVNGTTTTAYYAATDTANNPPHYQMGDRQSVTDALGHVTQFNKYDGNGRLLEQVDPNGVTTDYAYLPRGWLSTVTVTPAGGGTAQVTSYLYDGVGQLTQSTLPDGTYVKYTYDSAHRLTTITDSANDTVNYTLDAIGNRQAEKWDDPNGVLQRNIARAYDTLNRLQTVTGATQ